MLCRIVFVIVALVASVANAAPDVLVVCPGEYRAALAPWTSYRQGQGHELAMATPPSTARELADLIQRTANGGGLKYVVLVGDVRDVPTGYVDAKVNVRWGSEPTIATDESYADVDGDQLPDVAVGRIPVDTPTELSAVVRKIIRYERQADEGAWRRRVEVVTGVGGFGPVTDMLIEAAGRSVFQQVVPASYAVQRASASPADVGKQMQDGCLAWIYLGHGLPAELDSVETPAGRAADHGGQRRAATAVRGERAARGAGRLLHRRDRRPQRLPGRRTDAERNRPRGRDRGDASHDAVRKHRVRLRAIAGRVRGAIAHARRRYGRGPNCKRWRPRRQPINCERRSIRWPAA